MTIEHTVYQIIAQHSGVSVDDIKPSSRLREDLHFDSLDAIEVDMLLEDEFGIQIPDGVAQEWMIVHDVCETVRMVERFRND